MKEKINSYHAPYHWSLPYFYNYKYERPLKILMEEGFLGKNKTALDVGCGDGRISFLLSSEIREIYGIDNQPNPVKMGRLLNKGRKNVKLSIGDACDITFPDNSFDLVLAMDVIEHIPRRFVKKMMEEMVRVCKKGGHIIITTPNRSNLRNRIWGDAINPKHYSEYTLPEIARIMERAGLKIVGKYGIYIPPPIPHIEHYANIVPFRFFFRVLIDIAKKYPEISETLLVVARKP